MSELAILAEKLKKKHKGSIYMELAAGCRGLELHKFLSGVFEVDRCTGGWPLGRFISLWGETSSGKTTILFKTIAESYNYCKTCFKRPDGFMGEKCECDDFKPFETLYIDVEGTYDPGWAEICGVDNSKIYVSHPASAEIALDIAEEAIKSGAAEIIVLDSIAALTPNDEVESSHSDEFYAKTAKLLNKALRKLNIAIIGRGMEKPMQSCVFLLNQQRTEIGRFYTRMIRPGGKGQDFAASIEVRSKQVKKAIEEESGERFIQFELVVPKNKTYEPKLEGSYSICVHGGGDYKRGDTNEVKEVFKNAVRYDVIVKKKMKYEWCGLNSDGTEIKLKPCSTQDEFMESMVKNKKALSLIKMQTLEKIYAE